MSELFEGSIITEDDLYKMALEGTTVISVHEDYYTKVFFGQNPNTENDRRYISFKFQRPANATYAIEMYNKNWDQHGVAICGFHIIRDTMQIPHTPQGIIKIGVKIPTKVKDSFIQSNPNFRINLMNDAIKLAKSLALRKIEIISSDNHPKVRSGELPLVRARIVIDQLAEQFNFQRNDQNNYILHLNSKIGY